MKKSILKVTNLAKYFEMGRKSLLKAVDGISFSINEGDTLGLVGESGCGKSTAGKTIVALYNPTDGEVEFDGYKVHARNRQELKQHCKDVQMIFQDPYASLNPRMTVGDIVAEGMDIHKLVSKKNRSSRIYELLELVGLNKEHANRFPHEFSGGQRQRIGIARALAVEPRFIVCDEPVSALDMSIQAQVINLLIDLQKKKNLTYLIIAHDLSMVKHISDRICVMYLGKVMELATSESLYSEPLHPYTKALLSAVPIPDPEIERKRERIILTGDVPSPINPPSGCRFYSRCPEAMEKCKSIEPKIKEIREGHTVACHLW